jgi:hypothetical protein
LSAVEIVIAPEARLRVELPDGAREVETSTLPPVDLPPTAGVEVVAWRGWTASLAAATPTTVRVACVRAPSDRWAPGVESLVLARATAIAQRAASVESARWEPSAIRAVGPRFEQIISGQAAQGGAPVSVALRHVLAFAGERRDAALCTLLCVEPRSDARCLAIVESAEPVGTFVDPPPPGLMIRAVLLAAERPQLAGALTAVLIAALVALILQRRPRPRR